MSFDKVMAEIVAGRHDDKMKALVEALQSRLNADNVDAHWSATIGDERFTSKDMTYRALRLFERATGRDVNEFDVANASASDEAALLASWWASKDDNPEDAYKRAMDRVDALTPAEVTFDFEVEVHPGPFDESEAQTSP